MASGVINILRHCALSDMLNKLQMTRLCLEEDVENDLHGIVSIYESGICNLIQIIKTINCKIALFWSINIYKLNKFDIYYCS